MTKTAFRPPPSLEIGPSLSVANFGEPASPQNFERVCTTAAGDELFAARPDAAQAFYDTAYEMLKGRDIDRWRPHHLGTGKFATVYELPGYHDLCVKTVGMTPSKADIRRGGKGSVSPGLETELRFMDLVHRRLAGRPQYGVSAPAHFATVSLNTEVQGYAMLEERLPGDLISFEDWGKVHCPMVGTPQSYEESQRIREVLRTRFSRAIGVSALRLGTNDFVTEFLGGRAQKINGRNVWLQVDQPIETTPICVIDLVRGMGLRRQTARLMGALAS